MQNPLMRSFGRRKARKLRPQSQKAYEETLPLLKLDPTIMFGQMPPQEVWLEIGFGGGEHMLTQLAAHPTIAMVGCEPFMNGVAQLVAHLPLKDRSRVRVWPDDVRPLFKNIPHSYFSRAFILFPDPWPKKRHNPRRLITKEFIDQLLPNLKEKALLHVASDDPSYVEQMQEVLYAHPALLLKKGPSSSDPLTWEPRPQDWPSTRYEQKAIAKGHPCAYMVLEKRETL